MKMTVWTYYTAQGVATLIENERTYRADSPAVAEELELGERVLTDPGLVHVPTLRAWTER